MAIAPPRSAARAPRRTTTLGRGHGWRTWTAGGYHEQHASPRMFGERRPAARASRRRATAPAHSVPTSPPSCSNRGSRVATRSFRRKRARRDSRGFWRTLMQANLTTALLGSFRCLVHKLADTLGTAFLSESVKRPRSKNHYIGTAGCEREREARYDLSG
jgi:hypothetical protein